MHDCLYAAAAAASIAQFFFFLLCSNLQVLLKFDVPDELIAKQTRWHRIAMIRKLSSEQAAAGVKVDPTTISKYARGQRMSFLQLQQQTREKCQEIWDRQIQSLSVFDGDENESDSEENNSDLDSFAGDLENLLDAEECEEGVEGNLESKNDKTDGGKGLKMRRRPSSVQAEEEIEDEAAEAADLCRLLMDGKGNLAFKQLQQNTALFFFSFFLGVILTFFVFLFSLCFSSKKHKFIN